MSAAGVGCSDGSLSGSDGSLSEKDGSQSVAELGSQSDAAWARDQVRHRCPAAPPHVCGSRPVPLHWKPPEAARSDFLMRDVVGDLACGDRDFSWIQLTVVCVAGRNCVSAHGSRSADSRPDLDTAAQVNAVGGAPPRADGTGDLPATRLDRRALEAREHVPPRAAATPPKTSLKAHRRDARGREERAAARQRGRLGLALCLCVGRRRQRLLGAAASRTRTPRRHARRRRWARAARRQHAPRRRRRGVVRPKAAAAWHVHGASAPKEALHEPRTRRPAHPRGPAGSYDGEAVVLRKCNGAGLTRQRRPAARRHVARCGPRKQPDACIRRG